MKIKLTRTPPIDQSHGLKLGDEYETQFPPDSEDPNATLGTVWILSKQTGILVKLFKHEYEEIANGPGNATSGSMGPASPVQSES